MNLNEQQYLDLCMDVLLNGTVKTDRTGVGTRSVFGRQLRFDLQEGFPLLTTKKVNMKNIASELLWFMRGDSNIRFLLEHDNHIWDEWAFKNWVESPEYVGEDMTDFGLRAEQDEEFKALYKKEMEKFCERILTDDEFAAKYGDLGRVYGKQWREWKGEDGEVIDQLADVIHQIKNNPDSRRIIMSAWQPSVVKDSKKCALPPCHILLQLYVADGKLSGQFYMRSSDVFIGLPYNISSYSLMISLLAKECGLDVGELIYVGGDVHIYNNHIEQVVTQVHRVPYKAPTLVLPDKSIFDMTVEDIQLVGYRYHPAIKAPVAV